MELYLDVPISVKIINSRDATPISVRIIHMFHVTRTVTRITSHHCLERRRKINFIERENRNLVSYIVIN